VAKLALRRKGDLRLIQGGLNITWVVAGEVASAHAVIEQQVGSCQEAICGASPQPGAYWEEPETRGLEKCPKCLHEIRKGGDK
jgi:hypothetical protein